LHYAIATEQIGVANELIDSGAEVNVLPYVEIENHFVDEGGIFFTARSFNTVAEKYIADDEIEKAIENYQLAIEYYTLAIPALQHDYDYWDFKVGYQYRRQQNVLVPRDKKRPYRKLKGVELKPCQFYVYHGRHLSSGSNIHQMRRALDELKEYSELSEQYINELNTKVEALKL